MLLEAALAGDKPVVGYVLGTFGPDQDLVGRPTPEGLRDALEAAMEAQQVIIGIQTFLS